MKHNSAANKTTDVKSRTMPGLSLGVSGSTSHGSLRASPLGPEDQIGVVQRVSPAAQTIAAQPIAAPTWARYIDSRMKHFGTR